MIAVDSSVLINFLRGRDTPGAAQLAHCEVSGIPFRIPTICCQEVVQGAKDEREWKTLVDYLKTQEQLQPMADAWTTHLAAARIFFDCRRKGISLRRSVDCYIAEMVMQADDALLHEDDDFEMIRRVRPLKTITLSR